MKRFVLILLILILLGAAFITRAHNHTIAVAKGRAIVTADQVGEPTAQLLASLKNYVALHTGSSVILNMGGSYSRAVAAAEASAQAQVGTGQLYAEGQQKCAGKANSIVQARCVQDYVSSRLKALAIPVAIAPPNQNDYKLTFKSPLFAFDTATLLLVLAMFLVLASILTKLRRKNTTL